MGRSARPPRTATLIGRYSTAAPPELGARGDPGTGTTKPAYTYQESVSREAINSAVFTGRLGRDPNTQWVQQLNASVAKFSLAVLGAPDKPTLWLDVEAWSPLAEVVQDRLQRGSRISVTGYFRSEVWVPQEGGAQRSRIKLVARTVCELPRSGPCLEGGGAHVDDNAAPPAAAADDYVAQASHTHGVAAPRAPDAHFAGTGVAPQASQHQRGGGAQQAQRAQRPGYGADTANQGAATEREELWRDLAENPTSWWDNRSKKLTAKSPDFRSKANKEVALWVDRHDTPPWLHELLPRLKF